MNNRKIITLGLVLLLGIVVVGGLRQSQTTRTEADLVEEQQSAPADSQTPEDVMLHEVHGQLVVGFPNDIPHPPAGTIEESLVKNGGNGLAYTAEWVIAEGSVLSLKNYYREALPAQGWDLGEFPFFPDDAEEVSFTARKDNRKIFVSLEFEDGTLEVVISQPAIEDLLE